VLGGGCQDLLFLVKTNPETVSSSSIGDGVVRRAFIFDSLGTLEIAFVLLAISASSFLLNCDSMFSAKKRGRTISTCMKACLIRGRK